MKLNSIYPIRYHLQAALNIFLILLVPLNAFGYEILSVTNKPHSKLIEQGKSLYRHFCAHCHGVTGEGDGFNSENLDKDPADFTDTEFMAKRSDERLFRVISKGGPEVKKSFLMPSFGHTLSDQEIWYLIAYLRSFSGTKAIIPNDVSGQRPTTLALKPSMVDDFVQSLKGASFDEGEKLFIKKKACFACHKVGEEGGMVGPDLSRASELYPLEWLFLWLYDPQAIKPQTKMPNLGLSADETSSVVAYLKGLELEEKERKEKAEDWSAYLNGIGDPEKGKKLFFDSTGKASCGRCHRADGKGGDVGPSLRFIGSSRTKYFLLESILKPSEVITVSYSTLLILTKDGKFINGVKKDEDESSLDLIDKDGKSLHVPKNSIKKFKTQKLSMMPSNFGELLTTQEIRDILAYCGTLRHPVLMGF